MDYCDNNNDGRIDYNEFVNFLNWKDKMPSSIPARFGNLLFIITLLNHPYDLFSLEFEIYIT